MNTGAIAVLLALSVLALGRQAAASSFTPEQLKTLDGMVSTAISGLRDDAANMDALLKALGDAYDHSGYGKDPNSRAVREHFVTEAGKIKDLIRQVDQAVAALRARENIPPVMVYLLSREQAASFEVYKWCRSVIELTDLANASVGRIDAAGSELSTLMIREGEAQQDTISTAIQTIADKVLEIPGQP